jgi:hypothetical protein
LRIGKKFLTLGVLIAAFSLTTIALPVYAQDVVLDPSQIALAMTTDPTTSINITWTTIGSAVSNPVVAVWQANKNESSAATFTASAVTRTVANSTIPVTQKTFYSATITDLKKNTNYSYRVGTDGHMSDVRSFKTAGDNNGRFTFIYFSDSQTKAEHARGWHANLDAAKKMYPGASFLYIAGDLTDTTNNEGQWESFFNQPGNSMFNPAFSGSLISELPVAAAMGNHDASGGGAGGMVNHFKFASQVNGVPVSYAFDFGAAHFIILNLENAYSMSNLALRSAQTQFLTDEVAAAKAKGMWTFVGYHKSLYSGADHMDDSDVIDNRKYWTPIFTQLGVDFVLQGHDHVLSRGFIQTAGGAAIKVDITRQIDDREFMAKQPQNAPLYYVGNTASSLKFYSPLSNNNWIIPGDPVLRDYELLDINSAEPVGYINLLTGKLMNPGPRTDDAFEGIDPNFVRTPTFTAVTVTNGKVTFETYMTGFNPTTNSIVKDTFMYDTLSVTR